MKQYLSSEQTAKLVELGFEKPNGLEFLVREEPYSDNAKIVQRIAYSIGELIEFIGIGPLKIRRDTDDCWWVAYKNVATNKDNNTINSIWSADYELIDALYDMILRLKEEGVI